MAKQKMKHYYTRDTKSAAPPVPEISGKAKSGKVRARPIIAGVQSGVYKVYHARPHANPDNIPAVFSAIDNDLAVENLENDFDMTAADRQDL